MAKKYRPMNTQHSYAGNAVKQGASWGAIVALLIFFFPIGIALMLNKLHKDKANILPNAKKTIIVGWIFIALGILYLIMGLSGDLKTEDGSSIFSMVVIMVVLCCGGGYAIVRNAKKYKAIGLAYEKYLPILSGSSNGSLDDMAVIVNETYDVTSASVQKLIDMGMLENSYIDKNRRCLVSPLVGSMVRQTSYQTIIEKNNNYSQQTMTSAPKVKTIKCPNCGGINNVTEGLVNICDFCGSSL